jgi:hypothetical protein
MNQYIITEEVAEIIETALESDEHCKKCPYEGWGFNQGALSLLRECPYQSERDKVLDEMLAALQNEGMAAWDERGYRRFIQSFRQGQP